MNVPARDRSATAEGIGPGAWNANPAEMSLGI
jgi:hypothetical protein